MIRKAGISCWDKGPRKPGGVEIAPMGGWGKTQFGLKGGSNHEDRRSPKDHYSVFGDMNQEGARGLHFEPERARGIILRRERSDPVRQLDDAD
jgi:hypothetical protein